MGKNTRGRKNQINQHKHGRIYSLTDDIMLKILVQLPPETLQELRCVCKWWNEIISENDLIARNPLQSQPIFIVQSRPVWINGKSRVKMLEMDKRKFDVKISHCNLFPRGWIRSSCNGFILQLDPNNEKELLISNVVTKFQFSLPQCPSGCSHRDCGVALVFNPIERSYKVVHIYSDSFGFEIFSMGCSENKWKRIPGPIRGRIIGEVGTFRWDDPVSTNEQTFLHWNIESNLHIISMNICDEKWRRICLPPSDKIFNQKNYSLFEMKGNLSLMHRFSMYEFDIWVLKDYEGQVWSKSLSVCWSMVNYLMRNLRKQIGYHFLPDFDKLNPVVSLRNGEVIIFKHVTSTTPCWFLYDTKSMAFRKFPGLRSKEYKFLKHKPSLLKSLSN